MRRLLKYATVLAIAVAIGGYIILASPEDDDIAPIQREAALSHREPAPTATPASPESIHEEVAERLALETAKVERLSLADKAAAPGNPEVSSSTSSNARVATQTPLPASPPPQDAASATAAAAVSNDGPQDAKPPTDVAHPAPSAVGTDVAAGTELAALTPDEICHRDGEHLEQFRSHPNSDALVHFANQLGCKKLLPQVASLMKSLTTSPAAADVSSAAPSDAPAGNEAERPASSVAGADVASAASDETCKRDEDRLARLRLSASGEQAERFANELGCEKLRPPLPRMMENLGFLAPTPPAKANSALSSNSLLTQVCVSQRAALDRLRREPSAEAAGRFWRDLKCEGMRPQVRLLLESLDVAPETLGSGAARNEAGAHEGTASDAPTPNGSDPAACRKETAELNRLRATPDLVDARRFATGVTCDALKPQAARLLESLKE
jgi:hypothetical protein